MEYYLVDAFADGAFTGGQAAVCLLDAWPGDALLEGIAQELHAECTCFVIRGEDCHQLRWFTPEGEQGNMKYALVAAARALMAQREAETERITFSTPNGAFTVLRRGTLFTLGLSAVDLASYSFRPDMAEALGGAVPRETYKGRDLVFLFDTEREVRDLQPDFEKLSHIPEGIGVFTAAPGKNTDIAARAFWPKLGINEDSICGSMYCSLAPLWRERTGKTRFTARQLSRREGLLSLEIDGSRVDLTGSAVLVAKGALFVPGV